MRPDSHKLPNNCLRPFLFLFLYYVYYVSLELSLFLIFFVPLQFSLCMETTSSYVFSFRMVFFYLVTTGWIFYISLCENSIKKSQSINEDFK